MKREFTQGLRDLAKTTNFRVVKDKINAYFTLHDEIDVNDPKHAKFILDALKPFEAKDKQIYAFCKAFENRQALATLGASAALVEIKKTKLYSMNNQIKSRVDDLVALKQAGASEIKIFENYKNEVQGLVLDQFFNKYMSDVNAKYKQFRAYAVVDEAIEELSKSPNPELLGDVFAKLESAMSIPASQVPFYLIKGLSSETHLSPVIADLLSKLRAIDPMTQRNTMNQIRYVGNAGVYESVVAPVLFGESVDTVMLGNRLFNISEDKCEEPEEGSIDESFVEICKAFSFAKISEAGSISVADDNDNCIEIDENAEGGLVLTLNKVHSYTVDEAKGWQTELLGMQVNPGVVSLVGKLCESLENITAMDNIMSLQSRSGGGYSMYLIKQGKNNHMITVDPVVGAAAIQKNISVKEAVAAAMEAFGADVRSFFNESNDAGGFDYGDYVITPSGHEGMVTTLRPNGDIEVTVQNDPDNQWDGKTVVFKAEELKACENPTMTMPNPWKNKSTNEDMEVDTAYKALRTELDTVEASIAEIVNADDVTKEDAKVQELMKALEDQKAELCGQLEELEGKMATATN